MPPVVAAVVAYVSSITLTAVLVNIAITFAVSFVLTKLFPIKKPGGAGSSVTTFKDEAESKAVVLRTAIEPHRIVYGETILSGPLAYGESTNSETKLHLIIPLVGHECEDVKDVFFNEKLTTDLQFSKTQQQQVKLSPFTQGTIGLTINGDSFSQIFIGLSTNINVAVPVGNFDTVAALTLQITSAPGYANENYTVTAVKVVNGAPFGAFTLPEGGVRFDGTLIFVAKNAGIGFNLTTDVGTWDTQGIRDNISSSLVFIAEHLGSVVQTVDTTLDATSSIWTSAHRLRGLTYLYVRLTGDSKAYPSGVPNVKAIVKGRKIYDPRKTTKDIVFSSAASPSVFNIPGHLLFVGAVVFIRGHVDSVPLIYGEYFVSTIVDANNIRVHDLRNPENELNVTIVGTSGTVSLMTWSDNWALCVTDYLVSTYGLGSFEDEINWPSVIAAANICDEQVTLTSTFDSFTVDNTVELFTITGTSVDVRNGDTVQLTTTGTLPAGLDLETDYFVISISIFSRTIKLATTLDNSRLGIVVNVTDNGSGVHTLEHTSQVRYTCNGFIDTGKDARSILEDLKTSGAGTIVYSQGTFKLHAGAYVSPSPTLTVDNLRDSISLIPNTPKSDLYNAVRGTFVDPSKSYVITDFIPVKNAFYKTQDNEEEIFADIELKFTNHGITAQRLAKIMLEKSRQGIVAVFPCNLSVLDTTISDNVPWTVSDLGWDNKEFRIINWEISQSGGIDLTAQEESSASYDWNAGEETIIDIAPNTSLPNPFNIEDLNSLTLDSGTNELLDTADGNVLSRIRVSWTQITNNFVLNGGLIIISYKESTASIIAWVEVTIQPSHNEMFISPVQDGRMYDVRAIVQNNLGVTSEYVYELNHKVIGKTEAPSNVASLTAAQNGSQGIFRWPAVPDTDLHSYEIRYAIQGTFVWNSAIFLAAATRGAQEVSETIQPGTFTYGIRALDTSGNYSLITATADLISENTFIVVAVEEQHPDWVKGTINNMVKHHTGVLAPTSQNLASADGFDTFDIFVINPFPNPFYEADELDGGFDSSIRVYAQTQILTDPITPSGLTGYTLNIDYKENSGSYDGFEFWTIGSVFAQQVKYRAIMDTSKTLFSLRVFTVAIDAANRIEAQESILIEVFGTAITYSSVFHAIPNISVVAVSGSALIATFNNPTTIGFDAHVFDVNGTEVGGTINWQAIGA